MDDEQDIFEDSFKDEGAEVTEPKAETPPEPAPASEPEPPAAEPPQEPPGTVSIPAPKPEPGFVPFGAVLDERDKRKALEAEVRALREQRQQPQEPVALPDMFEDPEGYTSALAQTFEQRLYAQSLQMSERFARNQYGDELTDAAKQWAYAKCEADPLFNAQVRGSGDPVGFAVQQYQRDQIVQTVTPDQFEQFKAWQAAQAGLQQQPAVPAPTPQSPPQIPPKSLASAPSAGPATQDVVQSDDEIFEEVLPR